MVAHLRQRLHHRIGRAELAKAFGLAPQHVNAIFKKELGVSPTQFAHRELALEAMRLMQVEGLSVKETAARLGFHDQFHFSRVFQKVTGMRPSRMR
jgi:AraC-like DNA-binding protein